MCVAAVAVCDTNSNIYVVAIVRKTKIVVLFALIYF